MSDITANLGLPVIAAAQAQKHVTHNEALRLLDTLVQLVVLDRNLSAPPGSPDEGERWIVAASPNGAWAGHADDIAAWQDGAWQFTTPKTGWVAFVADEGTLLVWSGSAWGDFFATVTSIQNLALLGVGTAADATNPFSAKLNKALWTAKTAAEGGDGDLRYTLNKEGASDVLSLLLQRGFSGRAEIGLIGDDDVTLKVSADGSSWKTALVAAKSNAAVHFASAPPSSWGGVRRQTSALVAAITVEPTRLRTFLVDDLVTALIGAGVWDKLDGLYLFAAADSQAALLNWINPASTAASAVNSPTFTADQGFTGDGAASYVDAGFGLGALAHYQLDSASMFVWSLSDITATENLIATAGNSRSRIVPRDAGGKLRTNANNLANDLVDVADSLGLFTWSRGSSSAYDRYRNATSLGSATQASDSIGTGNLAVGRFSSRQFAAAGVGAHLSASEVTALYDALAAYLTELGAI